NSFGTNIILGMTKVVYSTQALREFEPSEIDRMLFPNSETATCACAASGNCAPEAVETCSAEISAGSVRWVTVYQNPFFDPRTGLLTHFEGVHTPASAHAVNLNYDPYYYAKAAVIVDEQDHSESFTYDDALRLTQYLGNNGTAEGYGATYDV